MIVGIDASNLRAGGGVTHLVEMLGAAEPDACEFSRVVVWGPAATLDRIAAKPWLDKRHDPVLDRGLLHRAYWQRFTLSGLARDAGCHVLFAPGGSYTGGFEPAVTMSRNMLPFEWRELRRFGASAMSIKLLALRVVQSRSFRRANGLIFLTRYAHDAVMKIIGDIDDAAVIIPHGVDATLAAAPREQRPIEEYTAEHPYRLLYVSSVDVYKHQWHVVDAVGRLRERGLPVALDLVGHAYPPALRRLERAIARVDPAGAFIRYAGGLPHAALRDRYAAADACVFASSCENMPNILLEGMAAALPIACSNRGPMPEVLGDGGLYFDPESPAGIAEALDAMITDPGLRRKLAAVALERSRGFTWRRCANDTFKFLAAVRRRTIHPTSEQNDAT